MPAERMKPTPDTAVERTVSRSVAMGSVPSGDVTWTVNGNVPDARARTLNVTVLVSPSTVTTCAAPSGKSSFGLVSTTRTRSGAGDVLRITLGNGKITYSKNGSVFYTSTVAPPGSLYGIKYLYRL